MNEIQQFFKKQLYFRNHIRLSSNRVFLQNQGWWTRNPSVFSFSVWIETRTESLKITSTVHNQLPLTSSAVLPLDESPNKVALNLCIQKLTLKTLNFQTIFCYLRLEYLCQEVTHFSLLKLITLPWLAPLFWRKDEGFAVTPRSLSSSSSSSASTWENP